MFKIFTRCFQIVLPNGWTVSISHPAADSPTFSADRSFLEVWRWDLDGESIDEPRLVSPEEFAEYVGETAEFAP